MEALQVWSGEDYSFIAGLNIRQQSAYRMKNLLSAIIVGVLLSPGFAGESGGTNAWREIAAWRVPMPKVKVLSGTELEIGGVRCALFGVRAPQSAAARAREFLEAYMKACGGYFSIYNSDAPISRNDGVPLVWLQIHGNSGWAQEALVRLGLAEVDFKGFEDYKFRIPTKSGDEEFDWKKCLSDAKAFHDAGEKPFLDFDWPPKK